MTDTKSMCILGGGIGGLVTLLSTLKLAEKEGKEIPQISLFDSRSEEDLCRRPQLILIPDLAAHDILVELIGQEKFTELSSNGVIHIGKLQRALLEEAKKFLENHPDLAKKVSLNFNAESSVLDMATGVVRHKTNKNSVDKKEETWRYDVVVNATGKRAKAKELSTSHGGSYMPYTSEANTEQQACVMFFVKREESQENDSTSNFHYIHLTPELLKELGWTKEDAPKVYVLSKSTPNGTVYSVVGEFPNTDRYLQNQAEIEAWMKMMLLRHLKISSDGVAVKLLESGDDPSLSEFTNKSLSSQKFPMYMEHAENSIYHKPDLGPSTTITIGDASSSANPHLATGAVLATKQAYRIAGALFSTREIHELELNDLFEDIEAKHRGKPSEDVNSDISTRPRGPGRRQRKNIN